MAMSTWPGRMTVSGDGLVVNRPSPSRTARMRAPVRSRMWASRRLCPPSSDVGATGTSSRRNSRLPSCMTTSRNSATWGWSTKAAMRCPPRSCGLTTRSAPALASFPSEASWRTRATMNRSGRKARAVTVRNRFVGVRREGGHEHAGPLDPRRPQHTLIGGVALQGGDGQAGQAVGVAVDHHHVGAPGGDEGGDAAPDAPVAADDHVPGPVGDAPFHPPPPQELPELPVDHGLDETAQDVDRRAHAPEDQHHREQSLPGGHGLDLAEADRRDRGDGLVERVHRREAEERVADRPRRRHEREGGQPEPGPAQGVHRRHPAARGGAVDDGQGPPSANWRT
jgi:hypothetical protein